ncbi:helix-turn-helix transcriptional regulator [Rhodococcoides kyotonense]|uniref:Regulatory protein, luxR family n=1 Tax=Rhodococcoides kyotonense TaxID=398843 RepID=A0A239IXI2_9NOCA|nr:LuxR C-terminal-related transcriptional regulator [Rhodococcus kyotonensis]SNS97114.1 regulatory protein, luxR family [Rhodococcus kyotonensis]
MRSSVPEATPSWQDTLSPEHLRRILGVLDVCRTSSGGTRFKENLVDAIATIFDVRDVTFFFGATYPTVFADPAPLLTGAAEPLLHEYQERWRDKDVFALPQARRTLTDDGFATLDDLARLPVPQKSYVEDYLAPHGMGTASAMHLRFADGEALVGMFDRERYWNVGDLTAMRLLAGHLRASSRSVVIGEDITIDPLSGLTPRQIEVAELISDGLTNAQIAAELTLTEMTVKKYVSRIFETTGLRNRAALTASMLRRNGLVTH